MINLKGLGVAMVTPFNADMSIDFESLKKLTHYLIDNGVHYLVVQGTTGESPVLSEQEKLAVLDTVIKENAGRLPIVYGIGGNNTQQVAKQLAEFDVPGVDAILSVSPYYSKPTQEGIFQHFKTLAANSKLPIILYNVPGRTSSNMLPETTLRLAKTCENIIGIKEACGDLNQVMHLIKDKPMDFYIISGDDDLALPFINIGGDGVISVIGNGLPKAFSNMINAALNNDIITARKFHYQCFPLIYHLFSEGNPAGIKEVLKYYNITETTVRLPLMNVSATTKGKIVEILNNL
ncbi:4-hydroxy-tetrahydrodipicolinate synthase [Putridiphycobacter roseus]|uniref:4-hydroxy-tetrahydrodipicolinate synthase n=1 Tax=Putridiphycobacter roseus TaxID=2219161 RepID=A0A2W1NGI9_9FLAO|nr:4-hydroxy-tetrahydrodipicolinate synthase [Putridiphycobacter roseus]PZE18223.1 4-hydroxy-tetrahydrodipicolinate synthase [Putridiphycobacter roseus]